jgi:hypothetical protein
MTGRPVPRDNKVAPDRPVRPDRPEHPNRPAPKSTKVPHVSELSEEQLAARAARQALYDNGQLTASDKRRVGPYAGIGPKWPTPRAS